MACSRLSAVLVVLVFLVAACGEDVADPQSGGAVSRAARGATTAASPEEPSAEALPKHSVRAWIEGDALVSVLANEAPSGAILAALSEAAGFELVIATEAELPQRVTLREQREAVEVVLARVLAGVPHALAYDKDSFSGAPRLARVTVGIERSPAAVASAPPAPDNTGERRRDLSGEEQEERAERAQRVWAQSLEDLESSDAEVRADGAQWLDVASTEGFQAATEHLVEDESPLVRAAAAGALITSDVGAVQPLLQALDDPDSRVVLAALEALEFVGDVSTVPHLQPLLEHRDVEVRERTVEAIEFLQ